MRREKIEGRFRWKDGVLSFMWGDRHRAGLFCGGAAVGVAV